MVKENNVGHVEIRRAKGAQFKVHNIGANGEILKPSERLKNYNDCFVNILAELTMYRGEKVWVKDYVKKEEGWMFSDGTFEGNEKLK